MKTSTKIIGIAIVIATGVSLYFISKKGNSMLGGFPFRDDPAIDSSNILFNPKSLADTLYEAMRSTGKSMGSSVGVSIGTDKEVIFDLLTGIDESQLKSIIKAFGLKPYNKTTGNQQFLVWQTPTKYGLKTWFKEELPVKDYALLRKKYPKIL